jgi:hypothetical protein
MIADFATQITAEMHSTGVFEYKGVRTLDSEADKLGDVRELGYRGCINGTKITAKSAGADWFFEFLHDNRFPIDLICRPTKCESVARKNLLFPDEIRKITNVMWKQFGDAKKLRAEWRIDWHEICSLAWHGMGKMDN